MSTTLYIGDPLIVDYQLSISTHRISLLVPSHRRIAIGPLASALSLIDTITYRNHIVALALCIVWSDRRSPIASTYRYHKSQWHGSWSFSHGFVWCDKSISTIDLCIRSNGPCAIMLLLSQFLKARSFNTPLGFSPMRFLQWAFKSIFIRICLLFKGQWAILFLQ